MPINIINPDWGYDNPLPCCIIDENSNLLNPIPVSITNPVPLFVFANATAAANLLVSSSGATATVPVTTGKTNILTKIVISHGLSLAVLTANITISGLLGGTILLPTEQLVSGQSPINFDFSGGLPASAVNTAITASVPSLLGGASSLIWLFYYQV